MAMPTLKENRVIFGSAFEAYSKLRKTEAASLATIKRAESAAEIASALIDTPADFNKQFDAALKRMAYLESRYPL